MKHRRIAMAGAAVAGLVLVIVGAVLMRPDEAPVEAGPIPVMSVALTRAQSSVLPVQVPATGNVAAWQEASIGTETDGLRLTDVRVNVGDTVRRGQVLATFDAALVDADVAEARAAVALAVAEAQDAEANAQRARRLDGSGALSSQQVSQYLAAADAAKARLDAARAAERRHRVRLSHTRVVAPGDGVVSSRTATVGAVLPAGQELFRMIRDGRLEWRARVAVADLGALAPGQAARLQVPGHPPVRGVLRMVAPDIDTQTHSGLVYVDLPRDDALRAGAFVTGHVDVGEAPALTLPQSAVLLRDGFHYVMRVGPASNVVAKKVAVGRRVGDRIEVIAGLAASEAVIASGLSFLGEGDTVRVVDAPPPVGADARAPTPARSNAEALVRSAP